MKRIILLFVVTFAFAAISTAQDVTLVGEKGQMYFQRAADLTITNTTPVWYLVKTDAAWPTTQHILIDVDSVSGNHTAMVLTLFGRNFDDAAWVSLSSTIVSQGVDANIDITATSTTETRWRQYKVLLTPTGSGVSLVDKFQFLLMNPD